MINSVHGHVPGKKPLHLDAQMRLFHPRPGQKQDASEIKAFSLQCLLPHSQALPNTLHILHYGKHISEASRWFQSSLPGVSQPPHRGGADPSRVASLCCAASRALSAGRAGCAGTAAASDCACANTKKCFPHTPGS